MFASKYRIIGLLLLAVGAIALLPFAIDEVCCAPVRCPSPVVQPAVPEFLGAIKTSGRRANRLDLANWLTDPEEGVGRLTARVFVNRFWYLLFGAGISKVLDDLGGQGEPPVHPDLLELVSP